VLMENDFRLRQKVEYIDAQHIWPDNNMAGFELSARNCVVVDVDSGRLRKSN